MIKSSGLLYLIINNIFVMSVYSENSYNINEIYEEEDDDNEKPKIKRSSFWIQFFLILLGIAVVYIIYYWIVKCYIKRRYGKKKRNSSIDGSGAINSSDSILNNRIEFSKGNKKVGVLYFNMNKGISIINKDVNDSTNPFLNEIDIIHNINRNNGDVIIDTELFDDDNQSTVSTLYAKEEQKDFKKMNITNQLVISYDDIMKQQNNPKNQQDDSKKRQDINVKQQNNTIGQNNTVEQQNNNVEQQNNIIGQNNTVEQQNNTIGQNNTVEQQNNTIGQNNIVEQQNNTIGQNNTVEQQNNNVEQQNNIIGQNNINNI